MFSILYDITLARKKIQEISDSVFINFHKLFEKCIKMTLIEIYRMTDISVSNYLCK